MNPYEITLLIYTAFIDFQEKFRSITDGAKQRFEKRDWHGQRDAVNQRMMLSEQAIERTVEKIKSHVSSPWDSNSILIILNQFNDSISGIKEKEIAVTFCISILRRIYPTFDFYQYKRDHPYKNDRPISNTNVKYIQTSNDFKNDILTIITQFNLSPTYKNLDSDIERVYKTLKPLIDDYALCSGLSLYVPLFFRNKHAYAVSCFHCSSYTIPVAFAFENQEDGITIDACLTLENDIKNIFSFSRSYLQVSSDNPEELLDYLSIIIPSKPKAQLYINLGYQEHGKELHLESIFSQAIDTPENRFIHAPGIKGTVMIVFTMPHTDLVFKILRDNFGPNKDISPADVKKKYSFVAFHDRVGRLVDTQYFEKLSFPVSFFDPSFLSELEKYASKSSKRLNHWIEISNVYMERKLVPLNIALEGPFSETSGEIVKELGKCIEELAYTNIFPGDLLDKNFGVTSEQKVIFYDFDEINTVTDCHFHELPSNQSHDELFEQEYSKVILPNDIFPEELITFILPKGPKRDTLLFNYAHLFKIKFWEDIKKLYAKDVIVDIKPYQPNLTQYNKE